MSRGSSAGFEYNLSMTSFFHVVAGSNPCCDLYVFKNKTSIYGLISKENCVCIDVTIVGILCEYAKSKSSIY